MIWCLAILAAVAGPPQPQPQPVERATLVLVRSLSYDRGVARESGELRIAVAHDPSYAEAGVVLQVLAGLRGVTVAGRPIGLAGALPVIDGADWNVALRGYDAIVLCPGIDRSLPALVQAAQSLDVVLLSLEPAYVGRGAALGVSTNGSRLELRVDPPEAVAQGADFSGELLELAHVVKTP